MEFNTDNRTGIVAPIRSDVLLKAVLNGDPLPLMRCEEADADRYSRYWKMVEFSGVGDFSKR